MKRDMELIRKIMFRIEEEDDYIFIETLFKNPQIEGYDDHTIRQHVEWLDEAGLIKTQLPKLEIVNRLTWEGCDFLDAARNEAIWNKVQSNIKKVGGTIAFEGLKALLIKALISSIGA
jgi:hypothetical protein